MSRMESILHPIFCLFLYFKLVATFDGNFSRFFWPFFLSPFCFFGRGSVTGNKLYVCHDGGIYITRTTLSFSLSLQWQQKRFQIYFRKLHF